MTSGSVAMESMKMGQYDKTITETQKAKNARYAAENQVQQVLHPCTELLYTIMGCIMVYGI